MAEFFRSMKVLAEDPVAGAPRVLMQTTAMDLVQQLNMIYDGLIDLQTNENRAVETKIGDINRLAQEIVELNKAIYGFEITGLIANDLRDKRNLFIDELAKYIDIEYEEYPDKFGHSMFKLSISGYDLLDHDRRNELAIGWMDNPLEGGERKAVPYWVHTMKQAGVIEPNASDFLSADDYKTAMDAFQAQVTALLNVDIVADSKRFMLDMNRVSGGMVKAHVDMRDGTGAGVDSTKRGIPYYIEMMNNLARALVYEINSQHVKGWSDNPLGSRTGILFFDDGVDPADPPPLWQPVPDPADPLGNLGHMVTIGSVTFFVSNADGSDPLFDLNDMSTWEITGTEYSLTEVQLRNITAKNLGLSQDIMDSPYNIAASSTPIGRPGDPPLLQRGNNENMNAIYDLFRKTGITMLGQDIGSFDDYGTVIRFDVGNTKHTAMQAAETNRLLSLAANNQRTAIAGVSLDEEMVGLVKYQHAYNGAARVITAMDDALDRLINGTGRVGL